MDSFNRYGTWAQCSRPYALVQLKCQRICKRKHKSINRFLSICEQIVLRCVATTLAHIHTVHLLARQKLRISLLTVCALLTRRLAKKTIHNNLVLVHPRPAVSSLYARAHHPHVCTELCMRHAHLRRNFDTTGKWHERSGRASMEFQTQSLKDPKFVFKYGCALGACDATLYTE